MLPRLGVIAYHPIQYHAPLHQRLAKRANVQLDVLFLSDMAINPVVDPGFGLPIAWDIDLLSGYKHSFLVTGAEPTSLVRRIWGLVCWLPSHDVIVVNGYNSRWMLLTMTLCRLLGIPYLLRASSHVQGRSTGIRRHLRKVGTRLVIAGSAGGLVMGKLNEEFYRQNHVRSITFAPNSVDDERFGRPPEIDRSEVLNRLSLPTDRPVIMFSGKLIPRKRPLDLAAAVKLLPFDVTTVFVGDGPLSTSVKAALIPGYGAVTGFINQSELPSYYHAADIFVLPSESEPWGLVVNEAMACGTLPVVSDQVGCAPDLAAGVGEIFPFGNVQELADALSRAVKRLDDPMNRDRVRQHAQRFSLDSTAAGFEQAAHRAASQRRRVMTRWA
jgi:glycosyltransferase involved in cell wall biosynthesis